MSHLEGVHWIKNEAGKLAGIHVDAEENPELFREVYQLIQALSSAREAEPSKAYRGSSHATDTVDKPIFSANISRLICEAKSSGEITQEQFFQRFPEWHPNAR